MTTTRRRTHPPVENACLVRWELRRGSSDLTCEVDSRGERSFNLQVVFGWCDSPALSEHFHDAVRALQRHAELTRLLRDAGWVVVTHTPALAVAAAG